MVYLACDNGAPTMPWPSARRCEMLMLTRGLRTACIRIVAPLKASLSTLTRSRCRLVFGLCLLLILVCVVLKAGVHVWVKDIQKLANLTNRSFPESAAEEIHFWSSIGEALEMTNTELRFEDLWGAVWTCEL